MRSEVAAEQSSVFPDRVFMGGVGRRNDLGGVVIGFMVFFLRELVFYHAGAPWEREVEAMEAK